MNAGTVVSHLDQFDFNAVRLQERSDAIERGVNSFAFAVKVVSAASNVVVGHVR